MSDCKILFVGPTGAGKTTAIEVLSEIEPVRTEAVRSFAAGKTGISTTVAMDYGRMLPEDGRRLHLYGAPGQARFQFMWDILSQGQAGVVLLIDNSSFDPFKDLFSFLQAFGSFVRDGRLVIGVTQMDRISTPTLEDYQAQLHNRELQLPVFLVDAREKLDLLELVYALLRKHSTLEAVA